MRSLIWMPNKIISDSPSGWLDQPYTDSLTKNIFKCAHGPFAQMCTFSMKCAHFAKPCIFRSKFQAGDAN